MSESAPSFRCGTVAVVDRPNVGKSTLVNAVVGYRISIVSRKPQTTRHRLLGISTEADGQIIFADTPGLHAAGKRAINRYMNRAASGSLVGVDLAVLVIEAGRWLDDDKRALAELVVGTGESWITELSTDELRDVIALRIDETSEAGDHEDAA